MRCADGSSTTEHRALSVLRALAGGCKRKLPEVRKEDIENFRWVDDTEATNAGERQYKRYKPRAGDKAPRPPAEARAVDSGASRVEAEDSGRGGPKASGAAGGGRGPHEAARAGAQRPPAGPQRGAADAGEQERSGRHGGGAAPHARELEERLRAEGAARAKAEAELGGWRRRAEAAEQEVARLRAAASPPERPRPEEPAQAGDAEGAPGEAPAEGAAEDGSAGDAEAAPGEGAGQGAEGEDCLLAAMRAAEEEQRAESARRLAEEARAEREQLAARKRAALEAQKRRQLEAQQAAALNSLRDSMRKEMEQDQTLAHLRTVYHAAVADAARAFWPYNLVGFMHHFGYVQFQGKPVTTQEELRKQLRRARAITHPDKHQNDLPARAIAEEVFKRLQDWETLLAAS